MGLFSSKYLNELEETEPERTPEEKYKLAFKEREDEIRNGSGVTRRNLDEPVSFDNSPSFRQPEPFPISFPDSYGQPQSARMVGSSYQIPRMHGYNDGINGWDTNANETIQNWFDTCKEYRWRYQFILDRNYWFAGQLNTVSIVFSSILSIFSGIKLWQKKDIFQDASNVVMLVSNSVIAGITTLSKKYIDDSRNEKIRVFVEKMDKFIGSIHAQVSVAPIYRIESYLFINQHTPDYTQLMTNCPNLTTTELDIAKRRYREYLEKMKVSTKEKV
jgi:hypothetical protein